MEGSSWGVPSHQRKAGETASLINSLQINGQTFNDLISVKDVTIAAELG
jgi:hypothetical protein